MENSSIISVKELTDGKLKLEVHSSNEYITLDLLNKSCEPLTELGETLLNIYDYYNENKCRKASNPESFFLFWECDNYQYTLEFILNPDQAIEIKISYCPDIFAGIRTENELQLSVRTNLKVLLENLLEEMKTTLTKYGFVGYRNRWRQRDFPVAVFLKLYNLLHGAEHDPAFLPRCLECLKKIAGEDFFLIEN